MGYLGGAPGCTLGSLTGSWVWPMGEFKGSWQLWKPLKNIGFYYVLRHRKGQGEPWRVPGGSLGALGRPPGHGGGSSGITWGFLRGPKAQSEDAWRSCDHLGRSLGRLWAPLGRPKKLWLTLIQLRELVLMGPGPPLSYKLKLIAQRNIGRSEIGPSLPGSNTPLGLSARRICIYI